jgi:hypothetical protein
MEQGLAGKFLEPCLSKLYMRERLWGYHTTSVAIVAANFLHLLAVARVRKMLISQ